MTQHDDKHKPPHGSSMLGLHKDWRMWTVVVLMLAAMLMYILSDEESLQPAGGEQAPVPAAP